MALNGLFLCWCAVKKLLTHSNFVIPYWLTLAPFKKYCTPARPWFYFTHCIFYSSRWGVYKNSVILRTDRPTNNRPTTDLSLFLEEPFWQNLQVIWAKLTRRAKAYSTSTSVTDGRTDRQTPRRWQRRAKHFASLMLKISTFTIVYNVAFYISALRS